jgi:hypothetical protein
LPLIISFEVVFVSALLLTALTLIVSLLFVKLTFFMVLFGPDFLLFIIDTIGSQNLGLGLDKKVYVGRFTKIDTTTAQIAHFRLGAGLESQ